MSWILTFDSHSLWLTDASYGGLMNVLQFGGSLLTKWLYPFWSFLYIYNKKLQPKVEFASLWWRKRQKTKRCYMKIFSIHIQRAFQTDSTVTGCDVILVTVYLLQSVLPHKASNKKKVNVMTQKSTNRYMQRSAQRQRWSQWAEGRCPHKDVHLRRAITQFVHKKHHHSFFF